jgi:hypothetical protein
VVILSFSGSRRAALLLLASYGILALVSCHASRPGTSQMPVIGVAYVGPVSLNLRQDLAAKSPGVTEVKHGARLDIIDMRRRLVRVRTADGVEGWVDGNLLLTLLDAAGFACSSGSACKTGNPEPSEVMSAIGLAREWGLGSLRVTLGMGTTLVQIEAFLNALPSCVEKTRAIHRG